MHKEILTKEQFELFPVLKEFADDYLTDISTTSF